MSHIRLTLHMKTLSASSPTNTPCGLNSNRSLQRQESLTNRHKDLSAFRIGQVLGCKLVAQSSNDDGCMMWLEEGMRSQWGVGYIWCTMTIVRVSYRGTGSPPLLYVRITHLGGEGEEESHMVCPLHKALSCHPLLLSWHEMGVSKVNVNPLYQPNVEGL